jgi:hypothetical protein
VALPVLVELVDERGLHAQGQALEGDVFAAFLRGRIAGITTD